MAATAITGVSSTHSAYVHSVLYSWWSIMINHTTLHILCVTQSLCMYVSSLLIGVNNAELIT